MWRPGCFSGPSNSWHLQVACLHLKCWTLLLHLPLQSTFLLVRERRGRFVLHTSTYEAAGTCGPQRHPLTTVGSGTRHGKSWRTRLYRHVHWLGLTDNDYRSTDAGDVGVQSIYQCIWFTSMLVRTSIYCPAFVRRTHTYFTAEVCYSNVRNSSTR